jgi:hypothetical protein
MLRKETEFMIQIDFLCHVHFSITTRRFHKAHGDQEDGGFS